MTTTTSSRLRHYRKERGLTLSELRDRTAVTISYLSSLERGKQGNPGIGVARRLAEVLEVSVDELFPIGDETKGTASMPTRISVEAAVRDTMDALNIEDDDGDVIEDAIVPIVLLARDFGHRRDWRPGWEADFAHRYISGLGFVGWAGLLANLDLDRRDIPAGFDRSVFLTGDPLAPFEILYAATKAWLTLIVTGVYACLGKG